MSNEFFNFDLFAAIILVGAIQGMFLFLLFLSKPHKQPFHNLILGMLVFSCALILLEIFLGYSGLITQALFLVDFSEPFVFVMGPLIFLLVRSMGGEPFRKKEWLHFIPFILYFFYHIPFLIEGDTVKFNAFLWAFHPEIPPIEVIPEYPFDPLYIRRNLAYLIIFHFGIYLILAFIKEKRLRNNRQSNPYFLSWIKIFLVFFLLTTLLYLIIKFNYQNDLGDHFTAIFVTLWLFFVSYKMLTDSGFFQPVVKSKYDKSSLSDQSKQDILRKLELLEQTEFYIEPSLSLANLAKQLGTSPHYLSQVLNEEIGKTYFDYIGQLRIDKAQEMLLNPSTKHFKIEEIAERSGYLSKSAFTTTFKKITGTTPGEFRKSAENKSTTL